MGYFAGSKSEQTIREIPHDWSICANRVEGYAVAYPSEWHTAELPEASACRFFDPRPLQIPENSDVYGFALEVVPAQESFEAVADSFTDPRFLTAATREDLEVGGRKAARLEATATGEGLYEKGLVIYAYVIDRGERPPLVLQTFRTPGSNWGERKRILDRASETLVLFNPQKLLRTEISQPGLPRPVERKRAALIAAARAHDYERLEALADRDMFQYTFGGTEGGPAAYWRELERVRRPPSWAADPDPTEALVAILQMPYTLVEAPGSLSSAPRIYVWPFAYDVEPGALAQEQRELLAPVASERELDQMAQFGSYIDWRTGITPDGRWIFFVSGD